MRTARPCKRKLRGILPAPSLNRKERSFLYSTKIDETASPEIPRESDRALARTRKTKYRAYRGSFPRNLGVSLETILSSRRKRHAGWSSGLDWANERAKERSLIPDEDGTIDGAGARAGRWMPKTQVVSMNSAMWGVGRGLLLGYTHYIGVLSFPWDRD